MTTGRMSLLAPTWLALVSSLDSRGLVGCLVLSTGRSLQHGHGTTSPQSGHSMCGSSKPQALVRLKA